MSDKKAEERTRLPYWCKRCSVHKVMRCSRKNQVECAPKISMADVQRELGLIDGNRGSD